MKPPYTATIIDVSRGRFVATEERVNGFTPLGTQMLPGLTPEDAKVITGRDPHGVRVTIEHRKVG
jgi:hypothetical protein